MAEENSKEKQADEIEALSCIYGTDFVFENEDKNAFSIQITEAKRNVILQVTLLENYPLESPPVYRLDAPWLERNGRKSLSAKLEHIYLENIGQSIIYLWVECIRQFLFEESNVPETSKSNCNNVEDKLEQLTVEEITVPEIFSGEIIRDRKSTFQPHLAAVSSKNDISQVLNKLNENRKISNATHNIYAYRYVTPSGLVVQDYEDDGEAYAGHRLLFLLQTLDVENVIVMVSRWYGGIHLGPDRFKHICNAAKNILESCSYLKDKEYLLKKKKRN